MLEIPHRATLSSLLAAGIRKAIAEGTWRECLPGERRLCSLFKVSRPTLRIALHQLADEKQIEIRKGLPSRLLASPEAAGGHNRLVLLVASEPISHFSFAANKGISEMRVHLAEQGFETEILVCGAPSVATQRRKIEAFLRHNRVFCSVLVSVTNELQQWFARQPFPALVIGSCHPSVRLPSLDIDYRSLCRHAVGTLLGKGHRQLALVLPNSARAGHLLSEEGFLQSASQSRHGERVRATVVRHNGTRANLAARLDSIFRGPQRPTALVVAKPQHVVLVMAYLLERGITVPTQVSLISCDYDYMFESVVAHYAYDEGVFAQRLSRLMHQMVGDGKLAPRPSLIVPRYIPGASVRSLSA